MVTKYHLFIGLDYDEAFEEGDDEDMVHENLDLTPALSSSTPMNTVKLSPTKTIMKSAEKETPLPKKSVRFSLRPGGNTIAPVSHQKVTIKAESSNEIITPDIVNQSDIGKKFSSSMTFNGIDYTLSSQINERTRLFFSRKKSTLLVY